jgi:polygalacturonase
MKHSNHLNTQRMVTIICTMFVSFAAMASGWDISPKVAAPKIPKRIVSLVDFGAVGDGLTMNTDAFERALGALEEKGGGKLVVPPGLWLTGPLRLRSNINLCVERGALIQFSGDYRLYPLTVLDIRGEKEVDCISPIFGQHLENVAITGAGIIDGGGDAWRLVKKSKLTEGEWNALVKSGGVLNEKGDVWWPSQSAMDGEKVVPGLQKSRSLNLAGYQPYHQFLRPRMLRLIDCKKVLIQDITFQNPPNWTMNPQLCEDISILNVQVRNSHAAQNSDALDLESCRRAIIRGCVFDTGDDGICLKSGLNEVGRRIGVPTEDVLIEDCTVYRAHGGFTIGSEMSGGVRNVRVDNCTFIGTDTGLRFKSTRGRGGVVEKIYISNVRMTDIRGDAINFNLYYGGKAPLEEVSAGAELERPPVTVETPQFRDIHIQNLLCRGANHAVNLRGLPEMPLHNITLKNASFTSQHGVLAGDAEQLVFENVRVQLATGEPLKTVRVKNSKLELVK